MDLDDMTQIIVQIYKYFFMLWFWPSMNVWPLSHIWSSWGCILCDSILILSIDIIHSRLYQPPKIATKILQLPTKIFTYTFSRCEMHWTSYNRWLYWTSFFYCVTNKFCWGYVCSHISNDTIRGQPGGWLFQHTRIGRI